MDFRLTDDQQALRNGMRELITRRFPIERLHQAAATGLPDAEAVTGQAPGGVDPVRWRELGDAGFFALRLPEADGGLGLGLAEAVLVFEEAGRALLPGPLVATELAAGLIRTAATGEAVITAADLGPSDAGVPASPLPAPVPARLPAPVPTLVEHLPAADAVLVLDGESARLHPARAVAPSARPIRSVDPTTPLHSLSRDTIPPPPLPDPRGHRPAVEAHPGGRGAAAIRREAALLTAALQLGSAFRTVEAAVDHARRRTQFGRPIGAFQAVQHRCAGMLVRAEVARCAVYAAALTEADEEIAAAKLLADEAAVRNARDCLQVHGGMGFTWEAEVHLHLKRAWVRSEQWLTGAEAEEALAAGLLVDRNA